MSNSQPYNAKNKGVHAPPKDDAVKTDMTISQWCYRRNYSQTTYYNLKRKKLAPEVYEPPGVGGPRITQKADAAWEKRMRALTKTEAARKEAERRSKQSSVRGCAAAKSPLHQSNRTRKPPPD